MDESDLARCHELLGVSLGCDLDDLERAFVLKDTRLSQGGSPGEKMAS